MSKNEVDRYLDRAGIDGEVEEVETGNVASTYRIKGEDTYYLQVPGHAPSLRRGILGLEMQQDTEVPVPEIVDYDLEDPFLVTEEVPGRNLQDTENEEVYRRTGNILAELHNQDHGFQTYGLLDVQDGELKPSGIESWRHGLDSIFNDYMRNTQRLLPMTEASKLDHYFMENRDTVPNDRDLKLGHFDFHGDNIIHQHEEVTGVLDWDMIRVLDPAFEVIKTERQFMREGQPHQTFRQGYEDERELEIDEDTEELYSVVSEVSRLSELQYLREAHGEEPEQEQIDQTMEEIEDLIS